jgi:hypothetical protein
VSGYAGRDEGIPRALPEMAFLGEKSRPPAPWRCDRVAVPAGAPENAVSGSGGLYVAFGGLNWRL